MNVVESKNGTPIARIIPVPYICASKFSNMLIIDVKETESIERALKKYKRKFDRSGVMKELRRRKHYTKPSVERRTELLKAAYKLEKYGQQG